MSPHSSSPHLAHRGQGRVCPSPCLGLEAEDGHNDGHNGGDEHGNQDSFRLVHATDRGDNKVTSHFSMPLPEGCWRHYPTAPILDRNPTAQGTGATPAPGSLSLELAALWGTGGTPERTWQSCLSSAPWPVSVGEKGELSGLPTCAPVPPSPPGELGCHGSTTRTPCQCQPTHKDAQQDNIPGEASPEDKTGER